jgi:hypothetical protein
MSMERIETGHSDLKAQVCFLSPPSAEYESPAPSLKLQYHRHRMKAHVFIDIVEGKDLCCL